MRDIYQAKGSMGVGGTDQQRPESGRKAQGGPALSEARLPPVRWGQSRPFLGLRGPFEAQARAHLRLAAIRLATSLHQCHWEKRGREAMLQEHLMLGAEFWRNPVGMEAQLALLCRGQRVLTLACQCLGAGTSHPHRGSFSPWWVLGTLRFLPSAHGPAPALALSLQCPSRYSLWEVLRSPLCGILSLSHRLESHTEVGCDAACLKLQNLGERSWVQGFPGLHKQF